MDDLTITAAYRILAQFCEEHGAPSDWQFESYLFSRLPLGLDEDGRDALARELVRRGEAKPWNGAQTLTGAPGELQFELTPSGQARLKRHLSRR